MVAGNVKNQSIVYNYSYSGNAGVTVQVFVNWYWFLLGTDSQSVTLGVGKGVGAQGSATDASEYGNKANVWLNDVQVATDVPIGEVTYTSTSGRINKIRVTLECWGESSIWGGIKSGTATASLDYTVNITDIDPSTDFCFIKQPSTNTATNMYFLRAMAPVGRTDRNIFIKNVGTGRRIWVLFEGINIADIGNSAIYFDDDYGCLTFLSDGGWWHIANYYPSNNQPVLPITTSPVTLPSKIATAACNTTINVFSTDLNFDRRSGDNQVLLPYSPNSICMIAYGGSRLAPKGGGNVLQIKSTASASTIDNVFTTQNPVYIFCDDPGKSAGIVFISDIDSNWYIVGHSYTPNWAWNQAGEGSYWQTVDPTIRQKILVVTDGYNRYYQTPGAVDSRPYFIQFKTQTVSGSGVRIMPQLNLQPMDSNSNVFNDDVGERFYAGGTGRMCDWIFSRQDGPILRWYSLISYTPG